MIFNPHALGVHKLLKHIPLNALFDAPYKARLRKAVNIADLRLIGKARSHKVRFFFFFFSRAELLVDMFHLSLTSSLLYVQLFF